MQRTMEMLRGLPTDMALIVGAGVGAMLMLALAGLWVATSAILRRRRERLALREATRETQESEFDKFRDAFTDAEWEQVGPIIESASREAGKRRAWQDDVDNLKLLRGISARVLDNLKSEAARLNEAKLSQSSDAAKFYWAHAAIIDVFIDTSMLADVCYVSGLADHPEDVPKVLAIRPEQGGVLVVLNTSPVPFSENAWEAALPYFREAVSGFEVRVASSGGGVVELRIGAVSDPSTRQDPHHWELTAPAALPPQR